MNVTNTQLRESPLTRLRHNGLTFLSLIPKGLPIPAGENAFGFALQTWMRTGQIPHDTVADHHLATRWASYHMPVFRPSIALASMLALTDISAISMRDIRLPFPTFVIDNPLEWFFDFHGQACRASLISVHDILQRPLEFDNTERRVIIDGTPLERLKKLATIAAQETAHGWWLTLQSSEGGAMRLWNRYTPDMSADAMCRVEGANGCSDWAEGEELNDKDHVLEEAAMRMVIGLALFIAEKGPGRKLGRHTTKSRRRRGVGPRDDKPEIYILGDDIIVPREIIDSATSLVGNRTQWRLRRRFVVRGHFRNQACGPQRQERRPTWIRPFWKGPEDGERLSHVYTTGDRPE
jgi:hypothetical protein